MKKKNFMVRFSTIFLFFNGIGITVCSLLAKYDKENNYGWNMVAASLLMFAAVWLILAIMSDPSKD